MSQIVHVHFPQGIFGFPSLFDMELTKGSGPFYLLKETRGATQFVLADPSDFFPDYRIPIYQEQMDRLGIVDGGEYYSYVILRSVKWLDGMIDLTANLAAPIVIGPCQCFKFPGRCQCMAEQFILPHESARHRLLGKRRAPCQG